VQTLSEWTRIILKLEDALQHKRAGRCSFFSFSCGERHQTRHNPPCIRNCAGDPDVALMRLVFGSAVLMFACAAHAQDYMDAQRLIWRCGAAARDQGLRMDSAGYGPFVQRCVDEAEGRQKRGRAAREGAATPSTPQAGSATITGELTYPGESLPRDLKVCAEDISSKKQTCTSRHIKRGRSDRYELKVAAGTYFVFATSSEWKRKPAYYSEFVTCGLQASCPSHKPIPVTVAAGERKSKIDPGDWYADN
jgi:hypothetical protein